VAHWCATEARFRNHLKKIKKEDAEKLISLENMLVRVTQQDVVYRRYLIHDHRSFIPDFGVYIKVPGPKGDPEYRSLSRQLVMFCVERRKAWRMIQSKAGVENKEYQAQRAILADVDSGKISREDFFARAEELMKARLEIAAKESAKPASAHAAPAAAPASVAPKPPAKPAVPVVPKRESEPMPQPHVVVARTTEITIARETETDQGEWEQKVQLRLMELDVDPGNDAGKRNGN